jgi:hypothetical protein
VRACNVFIAAILLLAGLAARIGNPVGFMPGTVDGKIAIVACPDQGPAGQFDHDGSARHHKHGRAGLGGGCDFASGPGAATTTTTAFVAPIALVAQPGPPKWRLQSFAARRPARERPPAQAPPLA